MCLQIKENKRVGAQSNRKAEKGWALMTVSSFRFTNRYKIKRYINTNNLKFTYIPNRKSTDLKL